MNATNTEPSTNSEKRDFIGGLITSVLLKKGTEHLVEKALDKIADNNNIPMSKAAVPPAKKEVLAEIKEDVQARAEHKLDIEPHLSSRNMWGSFVGIVTAVNTMYIFWTDGVAQTPQEYMIPIGIIIASLTPLYSRFIAKKPLWR